MQVIERLRRAREQRGLDIDALARQTRLRRHLIETVDQGRWEDLPRGLYARAVIRAYADAVGVDSHDVIAEVEPLLPRPEDPLDGMARVHGFDRRPAPAGAVTGTEPAGVAATPDGVRADPATTGLDWKRLATASVIDGALLCAVVVILFGGTVALSGATLRDVVEGASAVILLITALIASLYFLLLGGIAGATLGERAAAQDETPPPFRGTFAAACRRARMVLLAEGSILVTALMRRAGLATPGDRRAEGRSETQWEEPAAAR